MTYVYTLLLTSFVVGAAGSVWAVSPVTDADADAAFQQAVEQYEQQNLKIEPVLPAAPQPEDYPSNVDIKAWTPVDDSVVPDRSHPHYAAGMENADTTLSDVQLQINLEDVSLKEALTEVVNHASSVTGPWKLKFRLAPENRYVMDERVNLIAEANFGSFVSYLVDRVKNMTGVKLFISVFEGSRIIIVSDTYY